MRAASLSRSRILHNKRCKRTDHRRYKDRRQIVQDTSCAVVVCYREIDPRKRRLEENIVQWTHHLIWSEEHATALSEVDSERDRRVDGLLMSPPSRAWQGCDLDQPFFNSVRTLGWVYSKRLEWGCGFFDVAREVGVGEADGGDAGPSSNAEGRLWTVRRTVESGGRGAVGLEAKEDGQKV